MATTEGSAFERLLSRATGDLPDVTWSQPGDLGRNSVEAMIASTAEVRDNASHGVVRLHGAGVTGHAAPLESVGQIASRWQACVTAVGAALEGSRARVGPLARNVTARTRLNLNAAPAPGSIVLDIEPQADPIPEVYPLGQASLVEVPRPLADRAAEGLIQLLAQAVATGPDGDELGELFKRLGPRVASQVQALADVLDHAHLDVEATWMEPGRPTIHTDMPAGRAGWLRDFVAGRNLAGTEQELAGVLRTVSDVSKWLLETEEGNRYVDASGLEHEVVEAMHVGRIVRMVVAVSVTERPDGTTSTEYEALDVLDLPEPPRVP